MVELEINYTVTEKKGPNSHSPFVFLVKKPFVKENANNTIQRELVTCSAHQLFKRKMVSDFKLYLELQ